MNQIALWQRSGILTVLDELMLLSLCQRPANPNSPIPMLSTRVLTAAISVILGSHGAVAFGAAAKKASPPAPDACSLLTVDEIKSVVGSSTMVRKGRPRSGGTEKGTQCSFGVASGSLAIALEWRTPQEHEEFKKTLRDVGEQLEPVTGIGDDAFFTGERINVHFGNKCFALWFADRHNVRPREREEILALAKLCVAKLRTR